IVHVSSNIARDTVMHHAEMFAVSKPRSAQVIVRRPFLNPFILFLAIVRTPFLNPFIPFLVIFLMLLSTPYILIEFIVPIIIPPPSLLRQGVGAISITARVAFHCEPDEQQNAADTRDKADQVPPPAAAGVMQPANRDGNAGHQYREAVKHAQ